MKVPLLLLSLIAVLSGYSQPAGDPPAGKDSSVTCIAHWKPGETRVYTITRETKTIAPGTKTPPFSFTYEAWISVLDSSAKGYTIQWIFHIPDSTVLLHPEMGNPALVYNGLKMRFHVTPSGAFTELLNWEEVREAYTRQMEASLPEKMDSAATAILDSTKSMFQSKQVVEASLIQEIQLFHLPFGNTFTSTGTTSSTEIDNPLGAQPLPATRTIGVLTADPQKDTCTLVVILFMEKANTERLMDSLFKKMNIQNDEVKKEAREKYATFDMQDYTEYNFFRSTGWIRRISYRRIVTMAEMFQSNSCTITLKE